MYFLCNNWNIHMLYGINFKCEGRHDKLLKDKLLKRQTSERQTPDETNS